MHNKLKRDRHPQIKLKKENHSNNHLIINNDDKNSNNNNIDIIHPQHPNSEEMNTNKSNDHYSDQLSNKSGIIQILFYLVLPKL